jgi:zinc transport system substrate-binding protein
MIVMIRFRTSIVAILTSMAALACAGVAAAQPAPPLKIGVTLHPYYSWTKNIVGTLPGYEVRSILPGEVDAGDYQPRPDDIKKLVDLDAIVVNGIGHDDFILAMIKAAGNKKLVVIRPNETTPQIHAARGNSVNSHTFISFTNAVQQTYAIQKAIAALRPQDAAALQRNAGEYARRLRLIKSKGAQQLAEAKITRVVTVHDGYGYLLQEFGLEVAGVVQPAHGLTPSAAELRDMVKLLQREQIRVVFSEESFPAPMLKVLQDEGGAKVYVITHIASGDYTADKFEREMQRNVDTMIRALVTEA